MSRAEPVQPPAVARDSGTTLRSVLHGRFAAVGLYDSKDDRQAEAGADGVAVPAPDLRTIRRLQNTDLPLERDRVALRATTQWGRPAIRSMGHGMFPIGSTD